MAGISYGRVLSELAEEKAGETALVCGETGLTWGELETRANRMARSYLQHGVSQGDFVSLVLPNSVALAVHCFATWKCGAVPNPISTDLPTSERDVILTHASPALVVGNRLPVAGAVLLDESFEPDPGLDHSPPADCVSPHWRALASGGSTGTPKLIVLQTPALYDREAAKSIVAPSGRVLVPGPLCHAAPFNSFTQAMLCGVGAVMMERFDADLCLKLIERHRVEHILLVPTMMHRIWRLPAELRVAHDLTSLKAVFTGGAPCPPWLMKFWIDWLGPDVMNEVYGPSERIGGTFISGREWLEHPGSVGKAASGTHIRVLDADTKTDLAPGEIGEIYMMPSSGPGTTYKYLGATPRVIDEGWESVGDMGYLDREGYLYLTDRRTDMILCGGRNIYPAQIEAALDEHPAVMSSAVIGLPDEDYGQVVHAIIQVDSDIILDQLREHLSLRVAKYALPRTFEQVDFPLRDQAGKTRRFALRQERVGARDKI